MRRLNLLLLISIFLNLYSIKADGINIQDRIHYYEIHTSIYKEILSKKEISDEKVFKEEVLKLENKDHQILVKKAYKRLSIFFPKLILRGVIYFRYINIQNELLSRVLSYAFLNKVMVIRDKIDSLDHNDSKKRNEYIEIIKTLTGYQNISFKKFFEEINHIFNEKAHAIATMDNDQNFITALEETTVVNFSFANLDEGIDFFQLTSLGIIPGNKVKIVNDIRNYKIENKTFFQNLSHSYIIPNIDDFLNKSPVKNVYSPSRILERNKELIQEAKETIIFNLSLVKKNDSLSTVKYLFDEIIKKLHTNPKFKVILLLNKDFLQKNRSSLLRNIDQIKDSIFLVPSSYSLHKINYIIIDGNTNSPKAHLAANCWEKYSTSNKDSTLYIEGAAASLFQYIYLNEIIAHQLKTSQENISSTKEKEFLNFFKITKREIPSKGKDKLRLLQNHQIQSVEKLNKALINLIIESKKNIYIENLLLRDKDVVNALIKKKIKNKEIDIKIILNHKEQDSSSITPFLKELKKYGIEVRIRKNIDPLIKGIDKFKIISSDSKKMIISNYKPEKQSTSVNKMVSVELFSQEKTLKFKTNFLRTWFNTQKVMNLDIEHYQLYENNKLYSIEESALLNDINVFLQKSLKSHEFIY